MREIASKEQLRWAFLRWAFVTVPLVLLIGFASSRLAPSGDENAWYASLAKPAGTPPGLAFPIVWTLLYILQGLAVAMVLNARGALRRGPAIGLFALQVLVAAIWTPVFFGLHRVTLALGIIAALIVLAIATTLLFGRIRRAAAWLMVPYLVWLCYAAGLNYGILRLNPDADSRLVPDGAVTQIVR